MIFSELYSAYYSAMAAVLTAAAEHPVTQSELLDIIGRHAFSESGLNALLALREERWQLLHADGTSIIEYSPTMPLTNLQKRWLKAISLDPRFRLFDITLQDFLEVEPLFTPEDVAVFDSYSDGDPYEDETYQEHFRIILNALRLHYPLIVESRSRKNGRTRKTTMMPEYLEYSEKDDKFRLIGKGRRFGEVINLGRIISIRPCAVAFVPSDDVPPKHIRTVTFELTDRRNALERVLLHFAHFEKSAERLEDNKYLVSVKYDADDETELVIRILSFGPMIRVIEPESFVNLIKERLMKQKSCGI